MPKSIVICCDGTGNEIRQQQSNVLKFYRVLERDDAQVVFYDPGVGTISDSNSWAAHRSRMKGVFGLLTGYGLDANVLEAYRFLVRHYEDGDRIYLFGFSRGAYTIRVLGGVLHMIGLLHPHEDHLCGYALTAYKRASSADDFEIAWRVNEVLRARRVTIRFMGCWDTVGSVIIPRPDRFYLPSFESLPYTHSNPSVQVFRHAMAIDERRCMFRVLGWKEPQKFKLNPFVRNEDAGDQDIRQMWFAGVHADIGGGYPEAESALAKFPLLWMMEEAAAHGLRFRREMAKRLVEGQNPGNSTRHYVAPDAAGALHVSLKGLWRGLEYLPRPVRQREWPDRAARMGIYLPKGEPRPIPASALVHPSVEERRGLLPGYDPVNLRRRVGD